MIVQQKRYWNLNIYLKTLFYFIFNWSVYPLISSTKNGTSVRVRMSCPSWQWHRTWSHWFPVPTLPVAPLYSDLGFIQNSCGNKAAVNLCPALDCRQPINFLAFWGKCRGLETHQRKTKCSAMPPPDWHQLQAFYPPLVEAENSM